MKSHKTTVRQLKKDLGLPSNVDLYRQKKKRARKRFLGENKEVVEIFEGEIITYAPPEVLSWKVRRLMKQNMQSKTQPSFP